MKYSIPLIFAFLGLSRAVVAGPCVGDRSDYVGYLDVGNSQIHIRQTKEVLRFTRTEITTHDSITEIQVATDGTTTDISSMGEGDFTTNLSEGFNEVFSSSAVSSGCPNAQGVVLGSGTEGALGTTLVLGASVQTCTFTKTQDGVTTSVTVGAVPNGLIKMVKLPFGDSGLTYMTMDLVSYVRGSGFCY